MKTKILLFTMLCMLAVGWRAQGQTDIAAYSGESSPQATAVANATATALSRGAGITVNSGASFNSRGWAESSEADAVTANDYVEWSITASAGFAVEVTEMEVDYDRSGTGPSNVAIRTSLDGYTSTIYTNSGFGTSGLQAVIDLSASPLVSSTGGSITFRLYAWGGSSTGTFDIEDDIGTILSQANTGIRLEGSVTASAVTYTYNNGWSTDPGVNAPAATDNFEITAGTATLAGSYSINDLTVSPDAALDIGANTLTVNGTATLNADATGYGQVKGNISGTVNWESYLENGGDIARWFNVGMPVSAALSGISFSNGVFLQADGTAGQTNVYTYDAGNITLGEGTWTPLPNLSGNTTGSGFSLYLGGTHFGDLPTTMTVSGTLLNGNQSQNLTAQGAAPPATGGYGWNFVANPYAATLDWDAVTANNLNITTTYWVYNSANQWVAYNSAAPLATPGPTGGGTGASSIASRYIAPGQAFFVQSNTATQIDYAETDIALAETPGLLKTNGAMPNSIVLTLSDVDSNRYDFTFVAFSAGDDDRNDKRKDAIKRQNDLSKFPSISSTNGQETFIYNFTENADQNGKSVALNVEYMHHANLSVEAKLDYLPADWGAILEDKLTGTQADLRTGAYVFAHTAGNPTDRFVLHINKASNTVGLEEESSSQVYAYTSQGNLYVNLEQVNTEAEIRLYDVNGRLIKSKQTERHKVAQLNLSGLAPGVYISKVMQSGRALHTQKIIK